MNLQKKDILKTIKLEISQIGEKIPLKEKFRITIIWFVISVFGGLETFNRVTEDNLRRSEINIAENLFVEATLCCNKASVLNIFCFGIHRDEIERQRCMIEECKTAVKDVMIVNAETLNMRSNPTKSSKIAGRLRKEDKIHIIEKGDEWAKVAADNHKVGYVPLEYLRVEEGWTKKIDNPYVGRYTKVRGLKLTDFIPSIWLGLSLFAVIFTIYLPKSILFNMFCLMSSVYLPIYYGKIMHSFLWGIGALIGVVFVGVVWLFVTRLSVYKEDGSNLNQNINTDDNNIHKNESL